MILTRTPLRISLFGGGSDIPSYYENYGGEVLSTTIDQYMYTALCKTSMDGIKVVYNDIEVAKNIEEIKHDRVREGLRYFGVHNHVEISSFAEIPTKGTGLGSSSTFTVGLDEAFGVAFPVASFSPQELIRIVVVKIVRHTSTNFFINLFLIYSLFY